MLGQAWTPRQGVETLTLSGRRQGSRRGWGQAGLIVRQRTLLWAKCDFWGIGSEEWAVLRVTVTALPFLSADTAPPRTLLCPLSGLRSCPHPNWLPQLQESCLWAQGCHPVLASIKAALQLPSSLGTGGPAPLLVEETGHLLSTSYVICEPCQSLQYCYYYYFFLISASKEWLA